MEMMFLLIRLVFSYIQGCNLLMKSDPLAEIQFHIIIDTLVDTPT